MKILIIIFIVSAFGLSVFGLKCYSCAKYDAKSNFSGISEPCKGSSSPTVDCSDPGEYISGDPTCYWASGKDVEVKGCFMKQLCENLQRDPSSLFGNATIEIKCCATDLCNSEAIRSEAAKAKHGKDETDSKDGSVANRITVNGKLVIFLLVLPLLSAMYTCH